MKIKTECDTLKYNYSRLLLDCIGFHMFSFQGLFEQNINIDCFTWCLTVRSCSCINKKSIFKGNSYGHAFCPYSVLNGVIKYINA